MIFYYIINPDVTLIDDCDVSWWWLSVLWSPWCIGLCCGDVCWCVLWWCMLVNQWGCMLVFVVVMYFCVCCGDVRWYVLWWCLLVCVMVMYWCVLWTCGHVLVWCVDALVCVVMLYWWVFVWYGGVFWLSICMLPWCLKSDDCCDNL